MNPPVIILGAGGHAKVLLDIILASGREIKGILAPDRNFWGKEIKGIPIIGGDDCIDDYRPGDIEIVNGIGSIGDPSVRTKVFTAMKNKGFSFVTVIHLSAVIGSNIVFGEGVQIMAGAIIQPGCRIGDNVIVNSGVIMDHDCRIGDHVHLAPGVVLSGEVNIGPKTHIGTGACLIQGITIGGSAMIAAGAVVVNDIPEGMLARGVPAQPEKKKHK